MISTLGPALTFAILTTIALLLGAAVLHILPRLGPAGIAVSGAACRAPGLDLVITYFTVLPWLAASIGLIRDRVAGLADACVDVDAPCHLPFWLALVAAVCGQVLGVMIWTVVHESANPKGRRGPRIVHALNHAVGRWRNHTAVWWTALAVPVFFIIRVAEYIVYPPLTWLVRLPPYRASEWVNVSRQKFNGLVGHDLIWCLYCDWMTGVWSLGSEMLRNVESFWCPIRFASDRKCDHCSVDFPDVNSGWVAAGGTMAQVDRLVRDKYPRNADVNPWFGHPVRLTINRQEVADAEGSRPTR